MHIMVVDDEKDVQLLFTQQFRRELRADQMTLDFAFSGKDALDHLGNQEAVEVVLILSDINMPGMDGLELLKRIKEQYSHIKVFMITAYNDEHNYQTAMQYGADDYITKPINFAELKQKIRSL